MVTQADSEVIDLHCHLLPGIDDGPATLEGALDLARLSVANGITTAVATPHIQPGLYNNSRESIEEVYKHFREVLETEQIPLELGMAAEVRVSPEVLPMIAADQVPFLGEYEGYKLILLEFPHGTIPPGSDKMVNWLLARNIRPVIAHPERNRDVIRKLEKMAPFIEQGCLLQLTAGSVAGCFGPQVQQRTFQMLEAGWVTLLASDTHNRAHRPPELEPGRRAAATIVGEANSWALVRDNPAGLIAGIQ